MIELGDHRYGKSAIRLVKVVRGAGGPEATGSREAGDAGERRPGGSGRDAVRDLTIEVMLEGAFDRAYTDGDNSSVVATDTMKNTVYALAKEQLTGSVEAFGLALADHFLRTPTVERATIDLREHQWTRIRPGEDAFRREGSMTRTAVVAAGSGDRTVRSGVADLVLMKTAKSAFSGFPRDEFTALPDTEDRLMATRLVGDWRYARPDVDHEMTFRAVLETLLDAFAEHVSRSVQETIWILGRAILERHEAVDEVHLALPNLHHWLVDLERFGLTNDNEIFVATTEPHGSIEATVRRGSPSGA